MGEVANERQLPVASMTAARRLCVPTSMPRKRGDMASKALYQFLIAGAVRSASNASDYLVARRATFPRPTPPSCYFFSASFLASVLAGSFFGVSFLSSLGGAGGGSGVVSSSVVSVGGGIRVVYLSKSTFSPPLMVDMALKTASGRLSGLKGTVPSARVVMW